MTFDTRSPILSDRQGFDRRWYAPNLQKVYLPITGSDVASAWTQAIADGASSKSIQITCGRHCYEDFVYNTNTRYVIDLTGLRGYGVDSTYGYYIDVGYGNWDMFRIFNNVYGRTLPAGSCYSVGLGGHITGGGYGLLSRQWGLTVDHLAAVDIVVNQGAGPQYIQKVSASNEPDLFWAVRGGGGGNFGIITRYYFDNPPIAPSYMYTSATSFDWYDDSGNLLITESVFSYLLQLCSQYATYGQNGDQSFWPYFWIFHANHVAAKSLVWAWYYFDVPGSGMSGPDFEAFIADDVRSRRKLLAEAVRISEQPGAIVGQPWHGDTRSLTPVGDTTDYRQYTFLEGVQNANGSGPNRFGKYKSAYMKSAFTNTMVGALYDGLTQTSAVYDMSQSLCQIDSYGCAVNTLAPSATAIPQRSSIMKLQYQTYWDNDAPVGSDDPDQETYHVNWINNMYTAAYGDYGGFPNPYYSSAAAAAVDGCYFNYPDIYIGTNDNSVPNDPGIEFAMKLYFKENYDGSGTSQPYNLKSAKNTWNPGGWFASQQSIP